MFYQLNLKFDYLCSTKFLATAKSQKYYGLIFITLIQKTFSKYSWTTLKQKSFCRRCSRLVILAPGRTFGLIQFVISVNFGAYEIQYVYQKKNALQIEQVPIVPKSGHPRRKSGSTMKFRHNRPEKNEPPQSSCFEGVINGCIQSAITYAGCCNITAVIQYCHLKTWADSRGGGRVVRYGNHDHNLGNRVGTAKKKRSGNGKFEMIFLVLFWFIFKFSVFG